MRFLQESGSNKSIDDLYYITSDDIIIDDESGKWYAYDPDIDDIIEIENQDLKHQQEEKKFMPIGQHPTPEQSRAIFKDIFYNGNLQLPDGRDINDIDEEEAELLMKQLEDEQRAEYTKRMQDIRDMSDADLNDRNERIAAQVTRVRRDQGDFDSPEQVIHKKQKASKTLQQNLADELEHVNKVTMDMLEEEITKILKDWFPDEDEEEINQPDMDETNNIRLSKPGSTQSKRLANNEKVWTISGHSETPSFTIIVDASGSINTYREMVADKLVKVFESFAAKGSIEFKREANLWFTAGAYGQTKGEAQAGGRGTPTSTVTKCLQSLPKTPTNLVVITDTDWDDGRGGWGPDPENPDYAEIQVDSKKVQWDPIYNVNFPKTFYSVNGSVWVFGSRDQRWGKNEKNNYEFPKCMFGPTPYIRGISGGNTLFEMEL